MGTKYDLAGDVAQLIDGVERSRPVLDLFCGMCAVGGALSTTRRRVWGNDRQCFAATAAHCLIAEPELPPGVSRLRSMLSAPYEANYRQLADRFGSHRETEASILANSNAAAFRAAQTSWRHVGNDRDLEMEARTLSEAPAQTPYRLATITFAWGYFGLEQAMSIDSLRYAIDTRRELGDLTAAEARWSLVALLQAASCASSSPGHFAQYLTGRSDESVTRIIRQRRRDIRKQFLQELASLTPYGDKQWRRANRVFRADALDIWSELDQSGFDRGVIYADPPYTTDQYSRYYHVLETLTRYDYPRALGKGRYRTDRFATAFSLKAHVVRAFSSLCAETARRDHILVLSYPSTGLLNHRCGVNPADVLREYFSAVKVVLRRPVRHSTMGARHGCAARHSEELVWIAV